MAANEIPSGRFFDWSRVFAVIVALVIGGSSLVMVYQAGAAKAGGNNIAAIIIGIIGCAAVLYSMGALVYSRRFKETGRVGMRWAFIFGLLLSEGYIVFYELDWWSINVLTADDREKVQRLIAKGNIESIERAQEILNKFGSSRTEGEVNADIAAILAKPFAVKGVYRTLGELTKDCGISRGQLLKECEPVFALRQELATIKKVQAAKFDIGTFQAADQVVKPANAGADLAARVTGWKAFAIQIVGLVFGLIFLAFGRLTIARAVFPGHGASRSAAHIPGSAQGMLAAVALEASSANDNVAAATAKNAQPAIPAVEKKTVPPASTDAVLELVAAEVEKRKAADGVYGDVAEFYNECTRVNHNAEAPAGMFYNAYLKWCAQKGVLGYNQTVFGQASKRFTQRSSRKQKGRYQYRGRSLLPCVVRSGGREGGAALAIAA